jgi:cardiolipin synthase C
MSKQSIIFLVTIALSSCSSPKELLTTSAINQCTGIEELVPKGLSHYLKNVMDSMKTKTGVYVLEDGAGAMMSRAWFTQNSEKSIDIQYFIFSPDNIGLIACDYLVRAADRGVKIRILIDDIMVDAPLKDLQVLDSHPNISIKIYNPGVNLDKNIAQKIGKFALDFRNANQRMHNKTFIVDDKIVITGGRNIADEYFDYDHEYNFRDREVLMIGKACSQVTKSFQWFWESELSIKIQDIDPKKVIPVACSSTFDNLHQYACDTNNFWPSVRERIGSMDGTMTTFFNSKQMVWVDDVKFISDLPGKNTGHNGLAGGGLSTNELIFLINQAKRSIEIQTPYLITTKLGKQLFSAAIKRGVKLRILTNSLASTDNKEAFAAYQKDRKALLALGIEIYEFKPNAAERTKMMTGNLHKTLNHIPTFGLHAKTMVLDGQITVIGTFNLDPRSANLNTECFAVIRSKQITSAVLSSIETEFLPENAWRISKEFNPDNLVKTSKRIQTWTRKVLPKAIL